MKGGQFKNIQLIINKEMKIIAEYNMKRIYNAPQIELIILDNEISLVLESDPPFLPGEKISNSSETFNSDPFKMING